MVAPIPAVERIPPRCDHCGRPVRETRHTPTSYHVDYYSMHTGEVELSSLATEGVERVSFFKLLTPIEIITCVDCYQQPAVREERDQRFRPERLVGSQKDDPGE